MDWAAQRRQGRNTREITCPRTGKRIRISTQLLSKDYREARFPSYRIGQVGDGPNIATADHPDFPDFSTNYREMGAPGGFMSYHDNPIEDALGNYQHPRWSRQRPPTFVPGEPSSSSGAASSGHAGGTDASLEAFAGGSSGRTVLLMPRENAGKRKQPPLPPPKSPPSAASPPSSLSHGFREASSDSQEMVPPPPPKVARLVLEPKAESQASSTASERLVLKGRLAPSVASSRVPSQTPTPPPPPPSLGSSRPNPNPPPPPSRPPPVPMSLSPNKTTARAVSLA